MNQCISKHVLQTRHISLDKTIRWYYGKAQVYLNRVLENIKLKPATRELSQESR